MSLPLPVFDHLLRLTDEVGLHEHAKFSRPRREGYTTDDVSRALMLVGALTDPPAEIERATDIYLRFIESAIRTDGRVRNRRDAHGQWIERVGSGDSHGRVLWSLGHLVRHGSRPALRAAARRLYERLAPVRGPHLRPYALSVLGAAELLRAEPGLESALDAVRRGVAALDRSQGDAWPWPERRLTYANGRLPAALIDGGRALHDGRMVSRGLELLTWLMSVETCGGHYSLTPVGGWGKEEARPGFDQQPIEAWAMADACFRAFEATSDPHFAEGLDRAARWFMGDNDLGAMLYDPATGAGFDGLGRSGVNLNQGAESTISALATLALWHRAQTPSAVSSPRSETKAAPTDRSAAP